MAHGVTHVGHVRKTNEDHVRVDLDLGLFLVADGIGGHTAGEVASRMTVDTIHAFIARSQDGGKCTWSFGIDPDANGALLSVGGPPIKPLAVRELTNPP